VFLSFKQTLGQKLGRKDNMRNCRMRCIISVRLPQYGISMRRLLTSILLCSSLIWSWSAQALELRIGLAADITSLDPHQLNVGANNNAMWHIYDALTHVDGDTRLSPGLAESWRAVEPTLWEFKLRRGVRFHDGGEFGAEDVRASIERARALEATGGQFASFTKAITAIEVADAQTIRFRTATPYAMLPYDLNSIFIVSRRARAATTEDFNSGKLAAGTGPFRLISFKRGDRVELARNDAWWGPKVSWDTVSLRILPNDAPRTAALLAGDIDMIEGVPSADVSRLRNAANLRVAQKVSWRTLFFHLDQSRDNPPGVTGKDGKPLAKNPFKDIRVRRAISMAINRNAIVERVMEGLAIPAANIVSPPVFGHVKALKSESFDIEGAKKLLAEAGFADGFNIVLAAPNNRYINDDQIAQAVAAMLGRIGISAKVEALPAATYFTKARNFEFGFAMLGWGSFSGDLALRSILATPNADKGFGTWNWGRHSLPRLDAMLDAGFQMTDDKRREANAIEAATLAMGNLGVVPLHHQIASWAMKRGLQYDGRTDEYTFAHMVRGTP
jgi:peptide/nickel transport system substrate-binding protein